MYREFEEKFTENFYFTVTEKKWIAEKIGELEMLSHSLDAIIASVEISSNKKLNGAQLIEKIQEICSPVQMEFNRAITAIKKRVKYPNLSVSIPQNLEGEHISVEIKFKNGKQTRELIEFLYAKKDDFETLAELFQGVGIEF